jgi:hypothetical protein
MMADSILKARAAALFRELVAQDHRDALAEEKTRVERERAKMARRVSLRPAPSSPSSAAGATHR